MMQRLLCAWIFGCCLSSPAFAQTNKLIKDLESKRETLQQQMAETETLLATTKRDVGSQLNNLALLTGQMEERQRYLSLLAEGLQAIDNEIIRLNQHLNQLENELNDKRQNYAASLKFMRKTRSIEDKLLFIFSAKTLEQSYRRMRYIREYANYQQKQGQEIMRKQEETRLKQTELQQVRTTQDSLLKEQQAEQKKLETQEKQQRTLIANLQKRQRNLQNEIARKRREADQLNKRIDRLIAEELERSRREAEATAKAKSKNKNSDKAKNAPVEAYNPNTSVDRKLSDNFAANQGKLPVPITGPYVITGHYGQYSVEGLKNVRLDNKGMNLRGKPGAQARAIFQGKVAAVFKLNGLFNILIRHGAYISVYCNLSSATVKSGDNVETGQPLGPVYSDPARSGRTELHFQLRKEKQKLNPEIWLGQ